MYYVDTYRFFVCLKEKMFTIKKHWFITVQFNTCTGSCSKTSKKYNMLQHVVLFQVYHIISWYTIEWFTVPRNGKPASRNGNTGSSYGLTVPRYGKR